MMGPGKLGFYANYAAERVTSAWDIGSATILLKDRIRTLGFNLKVAGALQAAYDKGENDGWGAADKHYAKEVNDAYNEGFEAGAGEAQIDYRTYSW